VPASVNVWALPSKIICVVVTYVYKKTDETLGIDACNIHVQPLQHSDLLCNIRMKQLKHTSETNETLKTWACNMSKKHLKTPKNTSSLHNHDLPSGQLRWRRLAGWCAPARSRHACRRPRERGDAGGFGEGTPAGVGKGQRLA
jgi:hypothetical protein